MIDKNINNIVNFDIGANRLLDIAYKKIDKSEYINALAILKKALAEDTLNIDIQLEIASTYSKLNMIGKSNAYAYYALLQKQNELSLYILGNNFIKSHNYDLGIKYFNKLIESFPDGDYSDYVSLVVDRLQDDDYAGRDVKIMRLIQKGKIFLEKNNSQKAIRLYYLMNYFIPNTNYIKNNLALAYFYDKQIIKAIKITKEVIRTSKYDITANCNLSLFYYKEKKKYELEKHMVIIKKLKPITQEEYLKIISTCSEVGFDDLVVTVAKQAMIIFPCDLTFMFLLACGYYNCNNIKKSLSLFLDILKIDEDNYVAYYYKQCINSMMKPRKIDYFMQLPIVAVIDCVKKLKKLISMEPQELLDNWNQENRLITIWGLRYKDPGIKRIAINILSKINDEQSETTLRECLFLTDLNDDIKKDIFASLKLMNAKEPYPAFFSNEIVDVKVSISNGINNSKKIKKHQQVIDLFKNTNSDEKIADDLADIYVSILNLNKDIKFRSVNGFCGAIEVFYCINNESKYVLNNIAKKYNTTSKTIKEYLEKIFDSIGKE